MTRGRVRLVAVWLGAALAGCGEQYIRLPPDAALIVCRVALGVIEACQRVPDGRVPPARAAERAVTVPRVIECQP